MAYDFTNASSQILTTGTAPVTAEPLTIAAWFNRKNSTVQHTVAALDRGSQSGVGLHVIVLPASSLILQVSSNDGTVSTASSSTTYALNTWNHACGVFTSASSRTAYLNGGGAATNTGTRSVTGLANVSIGARFAGLTAGNYASCLIAEVGIWSAALNASEVAALAKGVSPYLIRPQSLVFCSPLVRNLVDVRGGLTITNTNGASVADHPRVYA